VKRLVKKNSLFVRLNDQDAADVKKAAAIESRRRGEIVGEATLVRELAMPLIRDIVAKVQAA